LLLRVTFTVISLKESTADLRPRSFKSKDRQRLTGLPATSLFYRIIQVRRLSAGRRPLSCCGFGSTVRTTLW